MSPTARKGQDDMTKLIMVGNGSAGGVGKTTLVQFLAEMNRRGGRPFTVVVADDKGKDGDGASVFAAMLPECDVVHLGAGPKWSEVEGNPDVLNTHWDKLETLVRTKDVLLDFGANVPALFAAYASGMRLASRWQKAGTEVETWVPFNNDEANLKTGLESLSTIGKVFGASTLIAVKNEMDGGFSGYDGTSYEKALQAFEKAGTRVVTFPKCEAPRSGMEAAMRNRVGFFRLVDAPEEEVSDLLGMKDANVALRTKFRVEEWVDATYEAFAGLVPETPAGN